MVNGEIGLAFHEVPQGLEARHLHKRVGEPAALGPDTSGTMVPDKPITDAKGSPGSKANPYQGADVNVTHPPVGIDVSGRLNPNRLDTLTGQEVTPEEMEMRRKGHGNLPTNNFDDRQNERMASLDYHSKLNKANSGLPKDQQSHQPYERYKGVYDPSLVEHADDGSTTVHKMPGSFNESVASRLKYPNSGVSNIVSRSGSPAQIAQVEKAQGQPVPNLSDDMRQEVDKKNYAPKDDDAK